MQQPVATRATEHRLLVNAGVVAAATGLIALAAQVSWGYPVPTTLQTFAVFSVAAVLGARRGVAAVLLYLGLGAVGAPVFAEGHGGATWLSAADSLHASGGYLWGFLLAAVTVGVISDRFGRSFYVMVPAMLLGSVALYVPGLIWLHQAFPIAWSGEGDTILHWGLWPFVYGDLAKIFAAAAVADPVAPWGRYAARLHNL